MVKQNFFVSTNLLMNAKNIGCKMRFDINNFSSHLFWDIDRTKIDTEKNKKLIVQRVLDYGLFSDWLYLKEYYGISEIGKNALKIRELDIRSMSFISLLANIPQEKFACFTIRQSQKKHWVF